MQRQPEATNGICLLVAAPARKGGGSRPVAAQAPDKYRVEVLHGSDRKVVEF